MGVENAQGDQVMSTSEATSRLCARCGREFEVKPKSRQRLCPLCKAAKRRSGGGGGRRVKLGGATRVLAHSAPGGNWGGGTGGGQGIAANTDYYRSRRNGGLPQVVTLVGDSDGMLTELNGKKAVPGPTVEQMAAFLMDNDGYSLASRDGCRVILTREAN
jgi:hypothetical protein